MKHVLSGTQQREDVAEGVQDMHAAHCGGGELYALVAFSCSYES